jgi:hypothetical protein
MQVPTVTDIGAGVGVSTGDLRWTAPDGQTFEPIACGVHRSLGAFNERPKGFQPDCANCQLELGSSLEAWHRSSSTEFLSQEGQLVQPGEGKGEGTGTSGTEEALASDEAAAKIAEQSLPGDPNERDLLREHGVDVDAELEAETPTPSPTPAPPPEPEQPQPEHM